MIAVIIAGGSGTRLWPLSTNAYPKQLLKLTSENSLVQDTYARVRLLTDKIYIVPEKSHAHHIKNQLQNVADEYFIVEPSRRGTANCIIATLSQIAKKHDPDEPIIFVSADHYIRDKEGFKDSFDRASGISKKTKKIVLVGIEPNYPATGFGYIERGQKINDTDDAYVVSSFKEKPNFDTAKKYLSSGRYLWNSGYFVGSINTFLDEIEIYSNELKSNYYKLSQIDDITSDEYSSTYNSLESNSIDYALIEKSKDLIVLPASFDWVDIGSFKDLHSVLELDNKNNYLSGDKIYSEDIENVYVRNEENKPIAVIGLDNIVIVNTAEGILVSRKDLSQMVGDIAKKIQT